VNFNADETSTNSNVHEFLKIAACRTIVERYVTLSSSRKVNSELVLISAHNIIKTVQINIFCIQMECGRIGILFSS